MGWNKRIVGIIGGCIDQSSAVSSHYAAETPGSAFRLRPDAFNFVHGAVEQIGSPISPKAIFTRFLSAWLRTICCLVSICISASSHATGSFYTLGGYSGDYDKHGFSTIEDAAQWSCLMFMTMPWGGGQSPPPPNGYTCDGTAIPDFPWGSGKAPSPPQQSGTDHN